jgi:hypothetical protein
VHNLPDGAPLRWDARHVHVGPYAVHLSTGRVTRNGEPVDVELPAPYAEPPMPWLPYDERFLERIAHTVVLLAYR